MGDVADGRSAKENQTKKTGSNGDDRGSSADPGEPQQSPTIVGALTPTTAPAGNFLRRSQAAVAHLETRAFPPEAQDL